MLYFAYGSNMSVSAMARRCPGATALGVAALPGHRLSVNRHGYVTARPRPGGCVRGVLWRLGARDIAALDAYEAVEAGWYAKRVLPVRWRGRTFAALVYCDPGPERSGRVLAVHAREIVAAALAWGLPAGYIAELRRLARQRFPSRRPPR